MHMIIYLLVYVCRSEKSEQVIAQPAEPRATPEMQVHPPGTMAGKSQKSMELFIEIQPTKKGNIPAMFQRTMFDYWRVIIYKPTIIHQLFLT